MKKNSILLSILLIFTMLVLSNFFVAQRSLKSTKTSTLSIEFLSIPKEAKVNQLVPLKWRVIAPTDFQTTQTTVYYDLVSTPSAVTSAATPLSLGYQSHLSDYMFGTYQLPDTFEAAIKFPNPGTYHLRGYSFVRGNNLWTDEFKISVIP